MELLVMRCSPSHFRSSRMVSLMPGFHYTSQWIIISLFFASIPITFTTTSWHPPRIETKPHDQIVMNKGVACFVCTVVGNPKPQIYWLKNGMHVFVLTDRYTVNEMPNGSVLRIEPVRTGRDDAIYECLARNGHGKPVRAKATLTVLKKKALPTGFPRFIHHPQMIQVVQKGRSVLLSCKAEGKPEPTITWYKDTIPLDMGNPRFSLVQGSSLQIDDAQKDDQGGYECIAENSVGTLFSNMGQLYVMIQQVPPDFSTELFLWQILFPCKASSQIVDAQKEYRKRYECMAENSAETAFSNMGQPIKQVPPYFTIKPDALYEVLPGGNVSIECVAVGWPMPYVKWRKGTVDLTPEPRISDWENILHLKNVRESANYTCIAASRLGNVEAHTQVTVQNTLPRLPTNVHVSDVTATSVRLSWSYDVGEENIIYYVIQYKPKQANQEYSEMSGITTNFYTIRDLNPYTEYEFYVLAVNVIGRGPPSTPAVVTTGETVEPPGGQKPGSAPRNVRACHISSTTVMIQWDQPEEPNGQVSGYEVYYTTQPNLPTSSWNTQTVDSSQLTTITNLMPHTIYAIRVQAFTSRGPGPLSEPVQVKTQQGVPGQPINLRAVLTSTTTVPLSWAKPSISGETETGYEMYWNDTFTKQEYHRSFLDLESYTLGDLYPHTLYYVWVAEKSRHAGEGTSTPPAPVRMEQYVPGEPWQVKVTALNSTAINVKWKPPSNKEQNGLIRGYQIHVQEMNKVGDLVNEPMRYDVADGDAEEYNITGLQPDTDYSVQVAAVTRKGDGTRSRVKTIHTLGGVSTRPKVMVHLVAEIHWAPPNHTYGELLNYRLRYGRTDGSHQEEIEINPLDSHTTIRDLDRGARYEFRLAGRNAFGWGQEAIVQLDTPEGVPTAPPQNLSHRLQSPTTVVVSWDPPLPQYRNGKITQYGLQFNKAFDHSPPEYNTTKTRMVFSSQDENTEYVFRVRAYTSKGPGPWSSRVSVHTPDDVPPAPANVKAMATSDQSVEVWWDEVPYFVDILGYQVLYTQTVVEDLDHWSSKKVPLTWSAELGGLESHTMYAIRVAVVTRHGLGRLSELITVRVNPTEVPTQLRSHTVTTRTVALSWKPPTKLDPIRYVISYGAHKEFFDSQGELQDLHIPAEIVFVPACLTDCIYVLNYLMPFTTYQVNVTAIPPNGKFRPPAKIIVTTAMAAPKPMVKPGVYDAGNGQEIIVVLPQASEEYGPISHYHLVVVPAEYAVKEPNHYTIEELSATPPERMGSYIAAKFPGRTMPETFALGDGKRYMGFLNKRLIPGTQYKIFVRAVVRTPHRNLYTSSPFSEPLGVEIP